MPAPSIRPRRWKLKPGQIDGMSTFFDKEPMHTPKSRPQHHEIPEGFVDGVGADDGSFNPPPLVIGQEPDEDK